MGLSIYVNDLSGPATKIQVACESLVPRQDLNLFSSIQELTEWLISNHHQDAVIVLIAKDSEELSELVPITSRDEVGLLTDTFNDTVVRLRSLVQTESERDQLRKLTDELKALAEVGRAVNSTLDLDAVLHTIISRASELAATEGGLIYEYDEVADQLRLRAVQNFEEELASALRARPLRK